MTGGNFRSLALAGLFATASMGIGSSGISASPVASGMAASGFVDAARNASMVIEVGSRAERTSRRWQASRDWYRRQEYRRRPYFGTGVPYYYGGIDSTFSFYPRYSYYTVPYDNDYYEEPIEQAYRGSRSCRSAHRACVRNWGYGGGNYNGCMKYERCRPR